VSFYADNNSFGHVSFRRGNKVVVVGDTASEFAWRGFQNSNHIEDVYLIPKYSDTLIREMNFEKRGVVVHFENGFYALHPNTDNSFWYQIARAEHNERDRFAAITVDNNEFLSVVIE
jgi:hypothetical protein